MYVIIDTELQDNKVWVSSYFFRINKRSKKDKNKTNRKIIHTKNIHSIFYKDPNNWYFDDDDNLRYDMSKATMVSLN
jgi:hypothetical protein